MAGMLLHAITQAFAEMSNWITKQTAAIRSILDKLNLFDSMITTINV